MVRTCGEKDRGRCSNEIMEHGSEWTVSGGHRMIGRPKLRRRDIQQN